MTTNFRCSQCGDRIPKAGMHFYVKPTQSVWCYDCYSPSGSSQDTHAKTYPECPKKWHDMWDHSDIFTSNAKTMKAWLEQHKLAEVRP